MSDLRTSINDAIAQARAKVDFKLIARFVIGGLIAVGVAVPAWISGIFQ